MSGKISTAAGFRNYKIIPMGINEAIIEAYPQPLLA